MHGVTFTKAGILKGVFSPMCEDFKE